LYTQKDKGELTTTVSEEIPLCDNKEGLTTKKAHNKEVG
jgi:hypothetical protein